MKKLLFILCAVLLSTAAFGQKWGKGGKKKNQPPPPACAAYDTIYNVVDMGGTFNIVHDWIYSVDMTVVRWQWEKDPSADYASWTFWMEEKGGACQVHREFDGVTYVAPFYGVGTGVQFLPGNDCLTRGCNTYKVVVSLWEFYEGTCTWVNYRSIPFVIETWDGFVTPCPNGP